MSEQYRCIRRLIQKIASYRVPLYAANASFYMILAFFPAIMLILSLLPLIGFTAQDLTRAVQSVTPNIMHPLMESIIVSMSENNSGTLISITAVVAVWSSSRSVYCIQQGLNSIYGVYESRSYLLRRIFSMLHMIILIAALLLTFVLHGFGNDIANYLEQQAIPVVRFLVKLLRLRGLLLSFLLSLLFTGLYCILPNCKVSVRHALPGALLSAVGWQIFTYGFSFYIRYSGSYSILYGGLASLAAGMLWLFICYCILFYGCVFNLLVAKKNHR